MMATIERDTEATSSQTGCAVLSPRVLGALKSVRRDRYVPEAEQELAYVNVPLPIGHGQTISQPFIVAIMSELLKVGDQDRVLEVGTGSGYQAAILSKLAREVYSIEIVPELATAARETLRREGVRNVVVRAGDGAMGWPDEAPFDRIIVTAAAPEVAPAWIAQLKPGGRLIAPIGPSRGVQHLTVLAKDDVGAVTRQSGLGVQFVPLRHLRTPEADIIDRGSQAPGAA